MDYFSAPSLPFLSFDDDDDKCLENVIMSDLDRYIFWIGGSLTFLTTFFLVIGSIRFKELRKQPGDLIIGIAVSDLALCIHWLTLATFREQINNHNFCQVVGAIGTYAGMNEFLYNVGFSIFLILSLRNALKQAKIPKNRFHLVTLTVSTVYLINMLIKNDIGKTLAGTCSIKSKCHVGFFNYFGSIIAVAYALLGLFTYYYIKRNSPRCAQAHSKRTKFLFYYLRYNIACTIIYFFIAFTNVLVTILNNPDKGERKFAWINSLFNMAKLSSPLVLSIIRFGDPMIRKYWLKTFFFWRKSEESEIKEPFIEKNPDENHISLGNSQNLKDKSAMGEQEFLFNELSSDWRTELTYTVLSCVLYASKLPLKNTKNSFLAQTVDIQSKNPYKHEKVIQIEEDSFKEDLPQIKEELERKKANILPGTLKIYSPEVFNEFVNHDREFLNIIESLDFVANREQIRAASDPKGGKSGEFFFFSNDKKLILKTVPDVELKMLISILENYEQHFKECPYSLIAKVYGAYTYENTDVGLKFNLVLMKNICGFPSKFVERAYDMKGSRYDREVLKLQQITNPALLKGLVLKDLDFEKYEKKLNIKPEMINDFMNQIELDSLFFRSVNLIDYSFMVFVVNKERAFEEMDPSQDFTANHPLASMESVTEPGLYYNMGIIDYLQPYNFQKWFERFLKRVKKLDPNLDTSSQNPHYYSTRFIQFIRSIVGGTPGKGEYFTIDEK